MPELPEIETLKRSLEPTLVGARVSRVEICRRDVIHRGSGKVSPPICQRDLLANTTISALARRGKQLAVISDVGPAMCIHLGMSGQMRFVPDRVKRSPADHVHCIWLLHTRIGRGRLMFRDPRRFGGIWVFDDANDILSERWSHLGPDALTIRAAKLARTLSGSNRPVKAALLDQAVLAGVGNIYADEALFAASIHPLASCAVLTGDQITLLAKCIRNTLRRAVKAGGTTLRDYADGNGRSGWFAVEHRVYGRAGQPCSRCTRPLSRLTVTQRTTVCCEFCQPLPA